MKARRRIGVGLVASIAGHLAAAAALLVFTADRDPRRDDEEDDALEWTELALVEDPAGPTEPAVTDEAAPPAVPAVTDEAAVARVETGARAADPPEPAAPERRTPTDDAPVTGGATPPPVAAEPAPGSPAAGAGPASGVAAALDPRRAVDGLHMDPGPSAPPGPLDGLRPRPARPRSELRPAGPDGFRTDEDVYVARTARDGTVTFDDARNLRIHIPLPTPRRVARHIEAWYESLAPGRPRPGDVDPDERIPSESGSGGFPVLGGSFDLTDTLLRSAGQDPYASRKMAFLDRTRDERMRLAASARSERLREAVHRIRTDLERLWRGPGTAADRRHLLFLLWDECEERGSEEVVSAARTVRGAVIAFVRRRLPAGSRDAFTAEELARENARRSSTERFDPYRAR